MIARISDAVKILAPLGVPEKILPMRESGAKSMAIGIDVPGSKLIAFVVSAFFAGAAGSL